VEQEEQVVEEQELELEEMGKSMEEEEEQEEMGKSMEEGKQQREKQEEEDQQEHMGKTHSKEKNQQQQQQQQHVEDQRKRREALLRPTRMPRTRVAMRTTVSIGGGGDGGGCPLLAASEGNKATNESQEEGRLVWQQPHDDAACFSPSPVAATKKGVASRSPQARGPSSQPHQVLPLLPKRWEPKKEKRKGEIRTN